MSDVARDALGLESGTVRVVAYDARWPELFRAEAARIASVVGPLGLEIEHTGSTSVPGLAAKPIIDMLAGRPPEAPLEPYVRALEAAGYAHRGEQGIPGRHFFRRGDPRSYHLHLAAHGGRFWCDQLAFRDRLRADPALRDAYAALKRALAARHPRDREAYIEGKSDFVREVLARA